MRPKLKGAVWERVGDELRVAYDRREHLMIEDADGGVERLLGLLCEGNRTVAQLAAELDLPPEDVSDALAVLDDYRLVEDAERLGQFDGQAQERYFSNFAFFECFASLGHGREDFQRRLRDAHVLVLGAGGLNSTTIPHLCGLGVGRLTLLDRDTVEPRNFARQFLYRHADIGSRKVERAAAWVRSFDPTIDVVHIDAPISSQEDVAALLDTYGPDLVMSGVDKPAEIDLWVNAACVEAKVPLVRAGMFETQGIVWSVGPGFSACRQCVILDPERAGSLDEDQTAELAALRLHATVPSSNRGIGPVAGLLGSLAAFEVVRYLTRFEPPAYAGRPVLVDFAAGCTTSQIEWAPDPGCPVCASSTTEGGDKG